MARITHLVRVLTGITVLTLASQTALADDMAAKTEANYPTRPIRIVVPSSPGGGIDVLARIFGREMTQTWGKPVIIDNHAGAGGIIGSELVAKAAPDGYTVLITAGGYTLNPSLYKKLPYDTIKDFERISLIACAPNLLVVNSSVPVHSVKELLAYAKARPNALNYASSGIGTTSYLAAELMKEEAGIQMTHIPYSGAGLSNEAILAGQVQLIFAAPHLMVPYVREGRVRALGVTSAQRLPMIPNVPTIAESGLPGFDVNSCYGMLAPAKTPAAVISRLNAEVVRILHKPDVRTQLQSQSFGIIASTPAEYTQFAKTDLARWAATLKQANIKPE